MNRKGQNVIEYILLVVAVVMVCIALLGQQGPVKGSVQRTLDFMPDRIDRFSANITFPNASK